MMRRSLLSIIVAALAGTSAHAAPAPFATASELAEAFAAGKTTSEAATRAALARIAALDGAGPALHAVIAVNPDALAQARAADARRRAGHPLGPLDGVPVLVKDNIETKDPVATTTGSLALAGNVTLRDAPVVARLRAAGAVILAKTNLSEWANIRSTASVSGWSATGGQTRNPHVLDRTACGSSSGSGAGLAAGYAPLALGTETDGSVVCPSSINGVVGLKPTLGLVSRTHVVPISHSQDTPGPMARSVADVAAMLTVIAGTDPADPATHDADRHATDYVAALNGASLKGVRIAVVPAPSGTSPTMQALAATYNRALDLLRREGAVLVEVHRPALDGLGEAENTVLHVELKADLAAYLATTPAAVTARDLPALIAFNTAHAAQELSVFGQEYFVEAATSAGLDDPEYLGARAKSVRLAAHEGIEAMLKAADADLLVEPTSGPAWPIDPIYGDNFGGPSASELPAVAGYPHLTVPMGAIHDLPVGLSFIARPWQEARVLRAGAVFEHAAPRAPRARFVASVAVSAAPAR